MKILLTLFLLLWAVPCFALSGAIQAVVSAGGAANTYACVDATHDSANSEITLCEDFDGSTSCADGYSSTCRNTWTVVKGDAGDTVDFDNTTAPAPLQGTYSLRVTSTTTTATTIYSAVTSADNYYFHGRLNIDTYAAPASDMTFVAVQRSTGANICAFGVDSATERYRMYTNSETVHATASPSADTTYYIWFEVVRNTSCAVYISTTTTKPETATLSASTFVDYPIARVTFYTDESNGIVFDHVRVNTSAFSSNPN